MTTCPNCGKDPCGTPGFCANCRDAEEKRATQPPKADDWIAAFSKKSNEELAKRAAENNIPPPPKAEEVIAELASKPATEYDQLRGGVAETLGIRRATLDERVQASRVELEVVREAALLPHWAVLPATKPVDAAKLFAAIEARILHHMAMPPHLAFVCALWVGQSWIHEHGTYSPILLITSPERDSGKSTLVGIIRLMAKRALSTVGISAAALYRSIERWGPTFVIDEADAAFADNVHLREVVNSGWTPTDGIIRCHHETHEPELLSTFSPKAIALKGKRVPDTILSRAVFIDLKRRTSTEKVHHFRHVDDEDLQRHRSQFARWAADNGKALGSAQPEPPEGFLNRSAMNWQLMLAIADSIGQGDRARDAARRIEKVSDRSSYGERLLADIKTMFDASTLDYVTTKDLITGLLADPEAAWSEWPPDKPRGPITQKGIAELLREYQILSKTVGPRREAKGYRKVDFEDAWTRYPAPSKDDADAHTPASALSGLILPSSRPSHCDDSAFGEKSAVPLTVRDGKKKTKSSNDFNEKDGRTGEMASGGEELEICACCGKPADGQPLGTVSDGTRLGRLHRRCEALWFELGSRDGSSPNNALRGLS
jgi:Protein of unknown function (DUF3631)